MGKYLLRKVEGINNVDNSLSHIGEDAEVFQSAIIATDREDVNNGAILFGDATDLLISLTHCLFRRLRVRIFDLAKAFIRNTIGANNNFGPRGIRSHTEGVHDS
jgi:hypothetical protein